MHPYDYELTPRVYDNPRLPRGIWFVKHPSKSDRPYAQRQNVIQKLQCAPPSQRKMIKVYFHRTELYHGLHGWIDVTDQFLDADGNVIKKS